MKVRRRLACVTAMLAVGLSLAGCSYVDRVAARLNSDGSLDFATCEASDADSLEVEWLYSDTTASAADVSVTPIVGDVEAGDVFRLDAIAPTDDWERVLVSGVGQDGAGISGYFRAKDLESGSWVWNQTGIFIGTVDVDHCDLDEANAR